MRTQRALGAFGLTFAVTLSGTALADLQSLTVERVTIDTGDFEKTVIGYDGQSPGPVLRFREGEEVTIAVTNRLVLTPRFELDMPFNDDDPGGVFFVAGTRSVF